MNELSPIFPFSTPIIAAILGIAFPLIMQATTTIDTKYGSKRLNGRFKREKYYSRLYISLIIAIAVSVYNQLVVIPWRYDCCLIVNWIMSNSSNLILLASMLYLVYILFRVVMLQGVYQNFEELFDDLHNKVKDNYDATEDIEDFVEIGKYVMLRDDNEKSRYFYQFLSDYTQYKVRKTKPHKNKPFEYDDWFYNTILYINHELLKTDQTPNSVRNGAEFIRLLISQPAELEISEKTYNILWRALQQQLSYKKTDWVYNYWANAYQYRWLTLRSNKHLFSYNPTNEQKAEIDRRTKQMRQFDEFHIALCGYILYLKGYDLIKDITSYSKTEPYQFPLVPSTFIDILVEYKNVIELEFDKPFEFGHRFGFPGVLGINAGDTSSAWYKRYLALLLFRLNSFEVRYMASWIDQWESPHVVHTLKEIDDYIKVSEQMLHFVKMWKLEENKGILRKLGWSLDDLNQKEEVSNDEIEQNTKVDPENRLEDFIRELNQQSELKQTTLTLSSEKVEKFKQKTKEILENSSYIYKAILNECTKEEIKKYTSGKNIIKDVINPSRAREEKKDIFATEGIISHGNFHEIDAQIAEIDFLSDYSYSFFKNAKNKYTISSNDLLKALDKLIGNILKDYEIIAFGDYFYTFTNNNNSQLRLMRDDELQNENKYRPYVYRDKLIINTLPSPQNSVMDSAVLIIKKSDMPCYENFEPDSDFIEKRKFEPVDNNNNNLKLFTSVVFDGFSEGFEHLENTNKCLVSLYYCVRLFWKKNADVTMLNLLTPFVDSGKGMNVNELPVLKG